MKRRGENAMGWDGDGTHKIQVGFRCLQNKAKSGSALAPTGPTHLATRPLLPDPTHECWHTCRLLRARMFHGEIQTTTSAFMYGWITSSFYLEVRVFLAACEFPAVPALLLLYATKSLLLFGDILM
jgi:hypothetical protein